MKIPFTKVFLNQRVDEEREVGRRKSRDSTYFKIHNYIIRMASLFYFNENFVKNRWQ